MANCHDLSMGDAFAPQTQDRCDRTRPLVAHLACEGAFQGHALRNQVTGVTQQLASHSKQLRGEVSCTLSGEGESSATGPNV